MSDIGKAMSIIRDLRGDHPHLQHVSFGDAAKRAETTAKNFDDLAKALHDPDTITLTREELEGMKDNQVQHLGNFPMVATWNAAIDAILEKMDS